MTYNKKQMQPLIDKYAINPETNKLFITILEMYDNQPNYQIWAVKLVFSKAATYDELVQIYEWVNANHDMVQMLDKKNIVSYTSKTALEQLFKEFIGLDRYKLVKDTISCFNTSQRKMLMSEILNDKLTGLGYYKDARLKEWAEVFEGFNRLSSNRKKKFFSNCSRFKEGMLNDLLVAIKKTLEESYSWDKEDCIAYIKNVTKDCEIVYEKDNYIIVRVPSFESSRLLCGNGRTSWCITQQESYFRQYVTDHANRSQYFLFDFSRKESDAFAHIGFTIENGKGFYCAQTCNNQDMKYGYKQGNENLNISAVLDKAGCKMSTFMRLNPLNNYKWDIESILEFVSNKEADYSIAYSKDGRIIINVLNLGATKNIIEQSLINVNEFGVDSNTKVYVFLDTNVSMNDERSIVVMHYIKDTYGTLSLNRIVDAYNNDITKEKYLSSIGISSDDYLNRENIDPRVMLHKYIDENEELAAIKLIESEGPTFDVNYEFRNRIPIIQVVNNKMYTLFDKIVNHPLFEENNYDGFGESLLESLMYQYGTDEVSKSKKDSEIVASLITSVLKSETYNFNAQDLNCDTAINIACEYPSMLWILKALVSKKDVDVNIINDFECSCLGECIRNKNLDALRLIGQRPDLTVRAEDKKLAKSYGIDLDQYIKPNEAIFGSYKFEDTKNAASAEKVNEMEFAATAR